MTWLRRNLGGVKFLALFDQLLNFRDFPFARAAAAGCALHGGADNVFDDNLSRKCAAKIAFLKKSDPDGTEITPCSGRFVLPLDRFADIFRTKRRSKRLIGFFPIRRIQFG